MVTLSTPQSVESWWSFHLKFESYRSKIDETSSLDNTQSKTLSSTSSLPKNPHSLQTFNFRLGKEIDDEENIEIRQRGGEKNGGVTGGSGSGGSNNGGSQPLPTPPRRARLFRAAPRFNRAAKPDDFRGPTGVKGSFGYCYPDSIKIHPIRIIAQVNCSFGYSIRGGDVSCSRGTPKLSEAYPKTNPMGWYADCSPNYVMQIDIMCCPSSTSTLPPSSASSASSLVQEEDKCLKKKCDRPPPCRMGPGVCDTESGECIYDKVITCNNPMECHTGLGYCDESKNMCIYQQSSDNSICQGGTCQKGICSPSPNCNGCTKPPLCYVGWGTCNTTTRTCTYQEAPDGSSCLGASGTCHQGQCFISQNPTLSGCNVNFWKLEGLLSWPLPYTTKTLFRDIFGSNCNWTFINNNNEKNNDEEEEDSFTLLEILHLFIPEPKKLILERKGEDEIIDRKTKFNLLARNAVVALLNAASPTTSPYFPFYTVNEIVNLTQKAWVSENPDIRALAFQNTEGFCPFPPSKGLIINMKARKS